VSGVRTNVACREILEEPVFFKVSCNPFRAGRGEVVAVEYKCVIQLHHRKEDALALGGLLNLSMVSCR
jgi:hypothetical protein